MLVRGMAQVMVETTLQTALVNGQATFERALEPRLAWALCTVARSGSSWISQLVGSTHLLGYPEEYLLEWPRRCVRMGLPRPTPLEEYLGCLLWKCASPNGVFAVKGSYPELIPFFDLVPEAPCVWLSRDNKIEQAISWHRAHDFGVWSRTQKAPRPATMALSLERVFFFYDEILRREAAWLEFFLNRRIVPLVLTYETVCRDPLAAVKSIASHVGIEAGRIERVESSLRIVRDPETAEMVELVEQAIRARG